MGQQQVEMCKRTKFELYYDINCLMYTRNAQFDRWSKRKKGYDGGHVRLLLLI